MEALGPRLWGVRLDTSNFCYSYSFLQRDDWPHQYSTGVEYVLVNGKIVLARGQHSGVRPGVILYGPGHAPPP